MKGHALCKGQQLQPLSPPVLSSPKFSYAYQAWPTNRHSMQGICPVQRGTSGKFSLAGGAVQVDRRFHRFTFRVSG